MSQLQKFAERSAERIHSIHNQFSQCSWKICKVSVCKEAQRILLDFPEMFMKKEKGE